jgi:Ran GTPase-activating protein (RanGAP) involved in mRNA processing and transport
MDLQKILAMPPQELYELRTINLACDDISDINDADFKKLCNVIKFCKDTLTELILSNNDLANLTIDKFKLLFDAIVNLKYLNKLDLSFSHLNGITDENNFKLLYESLSQMPALQELDISNNYLEYLPLSKFQDLCTALQQCAQLTVLDLEGNDLQFSGLHFKTLGLNLPEYKNLQQVNLSCNNNLNDNDELIVSSFSTFCESIEKCTLLQKLELRYNNLFNFNLDMLFKSLNKCHYLELVDLGDNELKNQDEAAINNLKKALIEFNNQGRDLQKLKIDLSNNEFNETELRELQNYCQAKIIISINNAKFSKTETPPMRLRPRC